jgi:diaminohydroxyphosphoribosylaminopyrimidine deaminase/5-amino-6-(5-phosphoribosylamino)uracil reductase
LRQRYDAIMVGSGTVLADRPELTVRSCREPQRNPIRIIFDPHGRLMETMDGADGWHALPTLDGTAPTVVLLGHTAQQLVRERRAQRLWEERRVLVQSLPPAASDRGLIESALETLQSPQLAESLGRPITSVMVEGGARLLSLCAGTVGFDLYHVFVAPKFGGGGVGRLALPAPSGAAMEVTQISSNRIGEDVLIEFLRSELVRPLRTLGTPTAKRDAQDLPWHGAGPRRGRTLSMAGRLEQGSAPDSAD